MTFQQSERRPPLVPLETEQVRIEEQEDVSTLHHHDNSLFDFGGESEFELMHVTVTLHGLTGIIAENSSKKKKNRGRGNPFSPRLASKSTKSATAHRNAADGSTTSSLTTAEFSSSLDGAGAQHRKIPTTAVVAFSRNVSNSDTKIYTHLPSIPLGFPSSSYGTASRYVASWPEAPSPFLDPDQEQSSTASAFTFLRVMMREPIIPGVRNTASTMAMYVHETIDMAVNLSRGKEMIALGVASLAISGDEETSVVMNVPVKPIKTKNKKLISTPDSLSKRFFTKNGRKKRYAFPSDPSVKYSLDENATLRVTLQVIPHETIKEAEVRKRAKAIHVRKLRERAQDNSLIARIAGCSPRYKSKNNMQSSIASATTDSPRRGLFQMFSCGCNNVADEHVAGSRNLTVTNPSTLSDTVSSGSDILDKATESVDLSLLSSVSDSDSESESESESDSDDESRGGRFLNKKIAIRAKSPLSRPNIG